MQRYILVRLSQSFVVLFAVSIIIFGLARLSGNPLDLLVPEDAEPEDIVDMERKWGLDRPLHVQYFTFLSNALRGDFVLSWRKWNINNNTFNISYFHQNLLFTKK